MAKVDVKRPALAGAVVELAVFDNVDVEFSNTGREFVIVANNGTGAVTVTYATTQAGPTGVQQSRVVTVEDDGEMVLIGPFPPAWFNGTGGVAKVTLSTVADVTGAVVGV